MVAPASLSAARAERSKAQPWLKLSAVFGLLFVFLVGIRGMGNGFEGLGKDLLDQFFAATANPFVGLAVGILGTTLVQSSSVTTSMIVALVAAPANPLPIANAIPMIMGANIGTTVTNSLVALGHIGRPDEFRRAFAAATCHDFFNFMAAAILLPLEILTGFLAKTSQLLSSFLVGSATGAELPNPVKVGAKAALRPLELTLGAVFADPRWYSVALIVISALIIFLCLSLIVKTLRSMAAGRMQTAITRSLDTNPLMGILIGIVVTVMVQSSSITTSVLVPLAGAGLVTVRQVFPITLGANVGTTVTALVASLAVPASTAHLAVQIASVHLLFNVVGIGLIYPWGRIRSLPINAAKRLARVAVRSRKTAIVYVLVLFYGIPGALIALSRWL